MNGIELRIKGKVQGVGFRPFVWLLANEYGLKGDVNNDGQGVLIRFVNPEKEALTQAAFAIHLNVSKNHISAWERGIKKPSGAALKLLNIIKHKGIEAIRY